MRGASTRIRQVIKGKRGIAPSRSSGSSSVMWWPLDGVSAAGHRPSRHLHLIEREAVEGRQMTLKTGQPLNHGQ